MKQWVLILIVILGLIFSSSTIQSKSWKEMSEQEREEAVSKMTFEQLEHRYLEMQEKRGKAIENLDLPGLSEEEKVELEALTKERNSRLAIIREKKEIEEENRKKAEREKKEKKEIEQKKRKKAEREAVINRQPKDIQELMRRRKVQIGMTKEQVTLSWGKPERINRTVGKWGESEQWVYGDTYLYFEKDIMTSFQDSTGP